MRARGRGAGILPCWDAVLEDVSSQEQRAAGSLCRAVGMGGFIAAPAVPDPTSWECLPCLAAGRQLVWLLRQVQGMFPGKGCVELSRSNKNKVKECQRKRTVLLI